MYTNGFFITMLDRTREMLPHDSQTLVTSNVSHLVRCCDTGGNLQLYCQFVTFVAPVSEVNKGDVGEKPGEYFVNSS